MQLKEGANGTGWCCFTQGFLFAASPGTKIGKKLKVLTPELHWLMNDKSECLEKMPPKVERGLGENEVHYKSI